MKRFVTYLYEYERGIKTKSTGFIKVDIRGSLVNMEICIRKFLRSGEEGIVYGLVPGSGLLGIELGEIKVYNGQGDLRLQLSGSHLRETDFSIDDLVGVGIRFRNQSYIASCWRDEYGEGIGRNEFEIWENAFPIELEEEQKVSDLGEILPENAIAEADPFQEIKVASVEPEVSHGESASLKSKSVNLQQKSASLKSESVNLQQKSASLESESVNLQQESVSLQSESVQSMDMISQDIPASQCIYRKIDLTHMREIPIQDRHYSSNAFLVHGFWNYGYLILKTEMEGGKKKASLGVPGVYERPEAAMALAFGFPKFETIPSEMVEEAFLVERIFPEEEIKQNQRPREKNFGCWFVELHA